MRYPNANNYESDYDFYLDCIKYCHDSVQAHYDNRKKDAIKALEELGDKAIGLAEQFKFESDIESELNEHLDAIQKLLEHAEPIKCLEL
jgi:hypothetical protein